MELTINEKNVLTAIVANAKSVGDTGIEFLIEDVARETGKSIRSISATVGNLQKKGAVVCFNGDGYFDGRVTEEGFQAVEIVDKVTQKVESNNKNENDMKEKDFDTPVVDERIVKLNELKNVKLNSLSKKQRLSAKANKYAAQFVLESWDDEDKLKKFVDDEDEKIHCYEVWCIADSRYKQLTFHETVENEKNEDVTESKEVEEPEMMKEWRELKGKHPDAVLLFRCGDFYETYKEDADVVVKVVSVTVSEENGIKVATFPCRALDTYLPKLVRAGHRIAICDSLENPKTIKKNAATPSETTVQSSKPTEAIKSKTEKKRGIKKAYKVGDVHPNHPNWIYTEYKPGKFDWRINKDIKSQTAPVKKEKKAVSKTVKTETEKTANKTISVEKFIAALQGKNLSNAQKSHLKLLKKGYRISNDRKFFELESGDRKACNWESVEALMKRVGVDEVEGLVK